MRYLISKVNWPTVLACAVVSLAVWVSIGMWQRHSAQHLLIEQQMKEIAFILQKLQTPSASPR